MINSGEDEDTIIRSILGGDVQISINAIDEVCYPFTNYREICHKTPNSARSIG